MDEPSVADRLIEQAQDIAAELLNLPLDVRVDTLNRIRAELHKVSPFQAEPVDYVCWVPADAVHANDYNPNSVAPEEMSLLRDSITQDGFTQPIVATPDDNGYEIIDGFHRNLTGRTSGLAKRLHGYLPITLRRGTTAERMAATVRHNRARGKHKVQSMVELLERFEGEGVDRVAAAKALGMSAEEVLRLTRKGGVAQALAGQSYSQAWEAEDAD